MKVEIFALCDFAQTEPTGKLNLLGVFDHLYAREVPYKRTIFAVAVRARFELSEVGPKTVALAFIDSDGKPVLPVLRAQFPVQVQPSEANAVLNCAMVIPQIQFARFGDYQLDLFINDKIEASIPFYLRQRPVQT